MVTTWTATSTSSYPIYLTQPSRVYATQPSTTATTTAYIIWSENTDSTAATTSYTSWRDNIPLWINPRHQFIDHSPRQHFRPVAPAIIRTRDEIEAASARARDLLISQLTPAQHLEFTQRETVTIQGKLGRYRLRKAIAANIDVIDKRGRVLRRLCAHPEDSQLPREDIMLAQLIHLRFNETEFLSRANTHPAPGNPETDAFLQRAEQRLRIAA